VNAHDWNRCKKEMPVGMDTDPKEAARWLSDWWRPLTLFIDRCMTEHEQTIFPSTAWSSGEAHLRANHRIPGQVVAQLPIVMNLTEIDVVLRGLTEIREALVKAGEAP
jgi:hypothetical protein